MIELAMTFCTAMGVCKDIALQFDPSELTVMQCMIGAQSEMAKWADAHPGYEPKRWSCGVSGRYAKA